jgi:VWFA-related protein
MRSSEIPRVPRALAVVLAVAVPRVASAQDIPVFQAAVEAVSVDVHVERQGHKVEGLRASNFAVRDNGVLQEVTLVARESVPVHAVLALDMSQSVAGARLEHLRGAARTFLDGLRPDDRVALLAFNHELILATGSAAEPREALGALPGIQASGGTALYDAVYAGLALADPRVGRPVVLVFSDGENRLSWLTREQILEASKRSEAVVYGVGAGFLDSTAKSFLRELAALTGGRVWQTKDEGELGTAFAQLLAEIQGRYLLRYEPKGVAGAGWHTLTVSLKGQQGELRTRRGYFRR